MVLGIEVCEVTKLVGEFVAKEWVGGNLPVTAAFAALQESRHECMLVVHGRSVGQAPWILRIFRS